LTPSFFSVGIAGLDLAPDIFLSVPQTCPIFVLSFKPEQYSLQESLWAFLITFWVTPLIRLYSSASPRDRVLCNHLRASLRSLTWRVHSSVQYGTLLVLPRGGVDLRMCREATSISEPMMLLWLPSMSSVTSSAVSSCLQSALKAIQPALRWSHLGTNDSSVETASSMVMRMGKWSLPMESSRTVQVPLRAKGAEAIARSRRLVEPVALLRNVGAPVLRAT